MKVSGKMCSKKNKIAHNKARISVLGIKLQFSSLSFIDDTKYRYMVFCHENEAIFSFLLYLSIWSAVIWVHAFQSWLIGHMKESTQSLILFEVTGYSRSQLFQGIYIFNSEMKYILKIISQKITSWLHKQHINTHVCCISGACFWIYIYAYTQIYQC